MSTEYAFGKAGVLRRIWKQKKAGPLSISVRVSTTLLSMALQSQLCRVTLTLTEFKSPLLDRTPEHPYFDYGGWAMRELYSVRIVKSDGTVGWLTSVSLLGERIIGPQVNRARFASPKDAHAAASEVTSSIQRFDVVPFWDSED